MARVRRGVLVGLLVGIASCLGVAVVQHVSAEEEFLSEATVRKLYAGLEEFLDIAEKPTAVHHGGRQLRFVNTDALTEIPETLDKFRGNPIEGLPAFVEKNFDKMMLVLNATAGGFRNTTGCTPRNLDVEIDDMLEKIGEMADNLIENLPDIQLYVEEAKTVQATESYVQVMSTLKDGRWYSDALQADVNQFLLGMPIHRHPCALAKHIREEFGVRVDVIDDVLGASRVEDLKTITLFEKIKCNGSDWKTEKCATQREHFGEQMPSPDLEVLQVVVNREKPLTKDVWNKLQLRLAVTDNPDSEQYTPHGRRVKQAYMRHLAREQRKDPEFGKALNTCLRFDPLVIEELVDKRRVPEELFAIAHPNKATVDELKAAIHRFDADHRAGKIYDINGITILNEPVTDSQAAVSLANQYQAALNVKALKILEADGRMPVWKANFNELASTKLTELIKNVYDHRADLSDEDATQVVLYDFLLNNAKVNLGTPELSKAMLFLTSTWRAAGAEESMINVTRVARCAARQVERQHIHLSTLVKWILNNAFQKASLVMLFMSNSHYVSSVIPHAALPFYWSIMNGVNALRSYDIPEVVDLKHLVTQVSQRMAKDKKWAEDIPRAVRETIGPVRSKCLSGPAP